MRYTVILAALLSLFVTGCASLNEAGTASYTFKDSVVAKDGTTHNREVTVNNGKEIADLDALIEYKPDAGYTVHLMEKGVAAFKGQEIAAGAAQTAAADAVKAAAVGAGVLIAPVAAPAVGAALMSGTAGAAAAGIGAGVLLNKAVTP